MTHIYKYILVFAVIALTSSCKTETSESTSVSVEEEAPGITIDQSQFANSKFELGNIEERSFSKLLNATGSIHVPEKSKAVVSTLMSGTVGAVNLLEGQWVSKGQKLFTVINPELINLQEEYLVANGQLEYLREDYNRQIELSKENLSTKKDLLKAKSDLNTTRSRHGALSKKLELYGIMTDNLNTNNLVSTLNVTAPISGYVSQIDVMRGMYIEPNQSAITLINTSQAYLELSVFEKDALALKKGQKVSFTLQGNPLENHVANVFIINKSINEKHMITVNCKIEDGSKRFVPGMYTNAKIILEDYKSSALPEEALVKMNEVYYALAVQSKEGSRMTFDKMEVKVGEIQNGYIELLEQSNPSLEFLTKGAYFLIQ